MKVQYLAPHPFYVERGTPICVDYMMHSLSDLGLTVDLCVYREGEERSYKNVKINRAQYPKWLGTIGPGFSAKKLIADLWLIKLAWGVHRRVKPDVIHAGEEMVFIAMLFKRLFGTPYIYDMDSSIAQQLIEKKGYLKPFARFFNWCEAKAIRGAATCAPVCNALADLAQEAGAKRVVVLHDISQLADPDRQATGFLREKLNIPEGRPILMYVGNLESYQGVDLLLDGYAKAIEQGVDIDLVVVGGSDPDIADYRNRVKTMGLSGRAHVMGRWPADQLDEILAEADILTAPRTKGINTPQKIFPYMHSGRPVLLTDLLTHNQVVDSSVCMLADATPEAFAEAIGKLATDPELRAKLGAAGRAFVEADFTYDAHCRRMAELYDGLARETAAGEPTPAMEALVGAASADGA
ncbi:MAG: glycosyltransferase family 4 protein [Planctomycetota bacterium]